MEVNKGFFQLTGQLFVQQKSTHMSMYSNLSHLEIAAKEAADWYRQWLIEAR